MYNIYLFTFQHLPRRRKKRLYLAGDTRHPTRIALREKSCNVSAQQSTHTHCLRPNFNPRTYMRERVTSARDALLLLSSTSTQHDDGESSPITRASSSVATTICVHSDVDRFKIVIYYLKNFDAKRLPFFFF